MNWRQLNAVVNARKAAADLIVFADVLIHGTGGEVAYAKRHLLQRLRRVKVTVERAITALEEGGT